MIKITNICKVFRTEEIETVALDNVSFEIKDGEFVSIMGPSGCGKSTLLNILGLLDNPTSGSYQLLGQEVAQLKEKDRTKFRKGNIGFVFQSFNLIDELNVFENIELPLRYMDFITIARKEKGGDDWFVGSITGYDEREATANGCAAPHRSANLLPPSHGTNQPRAHSAAGAADGGRMDTHLRRALFLRTDQHGHPDRRGGRIGTRDVEEIWRPKFQARRTQSTMLPFCISLTSLRLRLPSWCSYSI